MELTFQNFQTEYQSYSELRAYIDRKMSDNIGNDQESAHLKKVMNEFENLDVKMRLAFGISAIRLNNKFVSDKKEDLKLCHLLYYKLADLWFAYETYLKLFEIVTGTSKFKIVWLDVAIHNLYANSPAIVTALRLVNTGFATTYYNASKINELIEYLEYCKEKAQGAQIPRLNGIIENLNQGLITLTHTEILTIIYAIRNNFVHNGETTVVPNIFGFQNKSKLLQILYPYLSLIVLNATNITCRRV